MSKKKKLVLKNLLFLGIVIIFSKEGFSQQRSNITVFCETVDNGLEKGDVVVLANIPATEKLRGKTSIPKVKYANKGDESRAFGVVFRTGAKLIKYDPYEAINKEVDEAVKQGAKQEEIDKIKEKQPELKDLSDGYEIAIFGVVENCKVDTTGGTIEVGDLLTVSETKGYAKKFDSVSNKNGTILGRSLGFLSNGKGNIPILVTLQ